MKATNIVIHERGGGQILLPHYERFVPAGIRIESANTWLGYDPDVYVETNFFGEDDTRSYLIRMVTEHFTKIINVPNMKDHSASGVTGCLKNIAYGEFNNVARSHYKFQTETLTFIGTLARVEPIRTRTVLNIMDGLRGVWHGGPFSTNKRYRFYPKQMKFGTDPVAIDRLLIDVIDQKRQAGGRDFRLGARPEVLRQHRSNGRPTRTSTGSSVRPGISSTRRLSALEPTISRRFDTRKSRYEISAVCWWSVACGIVLAGGIGSSWRQSILAAAADLRHGRRIRSGGPGTRASGAGRRRSRAISRGPGTRASQRTEQRIRAGHVGAVGRIERVAVSARP